MNPERHLEGISQTINLADVRIYCETCQTPRPATNQNGDDVVCDECGFIIFTMHPARPTRPKKRVKTAA
jgi:DNA-directed RNA polymerase subunit RPC12/RpoP